MYQAVTHSPAKPLAADAGLKGKLFLDWSHLPFFLLLVLWLLLSGLGSPVKALDPDRAVTQYVQTVWQDELPQTSVFSIIQTRDGFLWVGTNEGIARFDGIEFRPFLQDHPIIKGRRINLLFEDSQGRLWVGASGAGLIMKDGKDWKPYTSQQGLPGNTPMALVEAADGTLWVLTETGIGQFRNGVVTTISLPAVITGTVMRTFLVEPPGTFWIGTDIGLFHLSNDEVRYLQLPPSPAGNQVQSLVRSPQGQVLAGTDQGVFVVENGGFTPVQAINTFLKNEVLSLQFDRDQNLWIGNEGGGLVRMTPQGVVSSLTTQNGLPNNKIWKVIEDREGSLWVGSNGGLIRLRNGKVKSYTMREGLSDDYIRTVFADDSGTLWMGGNNGSGVNQLQGEKLTHMTTKEGLSSNDVRAFYQDRAGGIWVGTNNGLNFWNGSRWSTFTRDQGLSNNLINAIGEDSAGRLWAGTENGLCRLENGRFVAYTRANGLPNNFIRSLFTDRSGQLWVGTYSGLARMVGNAFSIISQAGLDTAQILSFYEAPDGILWIGTNNGLRRFKNSAWTMFTTQQGLFDNTTFQILPDQRGNLWMSCNRGIFSAPMTAFDEVERDPAKKISCQVFGKADGMPSFQCNGGTQPAGCRDQSGRLWFPTAKGVVVVDPAHLNRNEVPPPVVINDVLFDQTELDPNRPAELQAGQESFEFHYAALSLQVPELVKFRYQLVGFDRNWIDVGARRVAYYTNLPPGEFTFRVIACNNDGVWNDTGASFSFRLNPPFWKTRTAFFLYVVATLGLIYAGVWFRLRTMQRRNVELAAKVAEQTAELQQTVAELQHAKQEIEAKSRETEDKNLELDRKNRELDSKIEELIASQKRADRIFSALAEALPGTVLDGKYRLDEKIGAGGFGAVFRATHLGLNRPIAVKIFRPSSGNDSAEAVERFRLEGVSASRVNHPNAIAILDSGISSDGIAYLVMELLEGHSLAEELKRYGRLSPARCARIIEPVCQVLAEAHRAGIIHRDIKPDNIFLHQSAEGEIVKVVDFGIAKLSGENTAENFQNLTASGLIIGTPNYMSPERFKGVPLDGRADVYSLGVTLYEMLCGVFPYPDCGNEFMSLVMAHLQAEPTPLQTFLPDLPAEIEKCVLKTLAKDPEDRPGVAEFGQEFSFLVHQFGLEFETSEMSAGSTLANLPTVGQPGSLYPTETIIKPNPATDPQLANAPTVQIPKTALTDEISTDPPGKI